MHVQIGVTPLCWWVIFACCLVAGCGEPAQPPPVKGSHEFTQGERFGLSFDERMAIPARLSRVTSDAQAAANRIYDKFQSRENALLNEAYALELKAQAKAQLRTEYGLTEAQLESIIREYWYFQGAPIR